MRRSHFGDDFRKKWDSAAGRVGLPVSGRPSIAVESQVSDGEARGGFPVKMEQGL